MSEKDDQRLKDHVLHIVKSLEEGYFSKDNLKIVFDDNEEYNPWHIENIETGEVLDNEYFEKELHAQNYLDDHQGELVSAYGYLQDALDIEYIVSSNKEYLGARVLITYGGPNIWINTRTQQVEGYWWGSQSIWGYSNDAMGLDDALNDLYNC